MPPLDPQHLRRTFGSVVDLLDEAHVKGVTIDPEALPMLLDTVEYYTTSPESFEHVGHLPRAAVDNWHEMVAQNKDQMITASSIWEWLRRFFPDPIRAGIIRPPGATYRNPIGRVG